MRTDKALQDFSDEQLHAELQRRVNLISPPSPSTDDATDLFELPAGSWARPTDSAARGDEKTLVKEYEAILRLGLARIKELLAIPLDPTDASYAAVLRGVNSAIGTFLTFISKTNEEMLRPSQKDTLPELLDSIKEYRKRIYEQQMPEWMRQLIELSDDQIDELLAKRREHLQWLKQRKLRNVDPS